MVTEIDPNRIAAEFLEARLADALDLAAAGAKRAKTLVRAKLARTYETYIVRVLTRHSLGKSFFVRTEPIPLYDFFVPLNLATDRRLLKQPGASEIAAVAKFAIITGSGGSGKTMLMRHLLITSLTSRSKTPVYLELRRLNDRDDSLRENALATLRSNGLDVDDAFLEVALKAGHFLFLLDGFDELSRQRRKSIATEAQHIAERYPSNWIVLSSRKDTALEGWLAFTQLHIQPLDLAAAVALVEKAPFDTSVKAKFISDLKGGLFRRHKSFLSNPLLLSIMLLTYSDNAHIPKKLSLFYNQAYEALFQKHDALKGGFQRERKSTLDIQEFERVFGAFSTLSFAKREFAFTASRALEHLDHSKRASQLDYDSQAVLQDAIQAVCLLVEEGTQITYAHRSFQEYFVARFVSTARTDIKAKLIKRFAPAEQPDAVMALLHELDPHSVERHFVLPFIESLRKRLGITRALGISHFVRFLQAAYTTFDVTAHGEQDLLSATVGDISLLRGIQFVAERYYQRDVDIERIIASSRALAIGLREEFPGLTAVPTRMLSTRSPWVRQLFATAGHWGPDYLRATLEAEKRIRRGHTEAEDSIEELLG